MTALSCELLARPFPYSRTTSMLMSLPRFGGHGSSKQSERVRERKEGSAGVDELSDHSDSRRRYDQKQLVGHWRIDNQTIEFKGDGRMYSANAAPGKWDVHNN